jgi:hypothetical protein
MAPDGASLPVPARPIRKIIQRLTKHSDQCGRNSAGMFMAFADRE